MTILVVEDEAPMRRIIADRLEVEGFDVEVAKDGEAGLAAALEKHPDLIILDLSMPQAGGLELMEKLREDQWGKRVPIILYTNLSPDDEILKEVTKDRPSYYMMKTEHGIDQVIENVNKLLGLS